MDVTVVLPVALIGLDPGVEECPPHDPQPIPIKDEVREAGTRPATWLVIELSNWGPREDLEDLQTFWVTQIIGEPHDLDPGQIS